MPIPEVHRNKQWYMWIPQAAMDGHQSSQTPGRWDSNAEQLGRCVVTAFTGWSLSWQTD